MAIEIFTGSERGPSGRHRHCHAPVASRRQYRDRCCLGGRTGLPREGFVAVNLVLAFAALGFAFPLGRSCTRVIERDERAARAA
jgi:hypothetical protein